MGAEVVGALLSGYEALAVSICATWAFGAPFVRFTLRPEAPIRARGLEAETGCNGQFFTILTPYTAGAFGTKVSITFRAYALIPALRFGTLGDRHVVLAGQTLDAACTFRTSLVLNALRVLALMNTAQGLTLGFCQAVGVADVRSVVAYAGDTARTFGTKVVV